MILSGIQFAVNRSGDFGFGRFILWWCSSGIAALVGFALEYGIVRASLAVVEGREPTFAEAWNMERFGPVHRGRPSSAASSCSSACCCASSRA